MPPYYLYYWLTFITSVSILGDQSDLTHPYAPVQKQLIWLKGSDSSANAGGYTAKPRATYTH